jgi:hypothetical protein
LKKNKLNKPNSVITISAGGSLVWNGNAGTINQALSTIPQTITIPQITKPKDFKNCYRVDITFSTYFSDEEDSLNSSIALKENIKKEFGQLGTIKSIKITEELNYCRTHYLNSPYGKLYFQKIEEEYFKLSETNDEIFLEKVPINFRDGIAWVIFEEFEAKILENT